ncbi:MAG: hypothetical protein ABIS51_07980 [Sphingomonas sp.]
MDNLTNTVLFATLLLFSIAFWLVITGLIGLFSGWFTLQSRYPDTEEPALITLRRQSGSMGPGVAMNRLLRLSACPSGLRIGIPRMYGLFQRPFLVPWDEITATPKKTFFVPMARLALGYPQIGSITIDARSWERLAAHSLDHVRQDDRFTPVSSRGTGRGLVLEWLVMSALAATFFAVASRLQSVSAPVPLAACIAFPAVVIGFGQLVRYARMHF